MKRLLIAIACISMCLAIAVVCVEAHPGRTDSNGGHYDYSEGEYHYHHGQPAHYHYDMDGDGEEDCPYVISATIKKQKEEEKKKRHDKVKNILEPCFVAILGIIMAYCAYVFIRVVIETINERK